MVNKTLSALLCFSPSLNLLDTTFSADYSVSFPIHIEMSSDSIHGRTLQFRTDFQHLQNFTYVSDPVFFPFPDEDRMRKFFTDERNLVLEVDDHYSSCF